MRVLKAREVEIVESLHWYFHCGGLEMHLEFAGFDIPTPAIRRKICEPYT